MKPEASLPLEIRQRRAFQKPWHATAFAMLLSLHQADRFTWPQWTEAFAQSERTSPQRAGECIEDAYYRRVLETLLAFLSAQKLVQPAEVAAVEAAWRGAYLSTPHGQPVELAPETLARALSGEAAWHGDDDHGHHAAHHHHSHGTPRVVTPVAVSPARGA